ncbi:ribulose phosphate epimerase [Pseudenhygromyxa sp. WMMC2535]|uniref:ribulose phosphate epimerase n=1 Tax=Pseudenhygromyxa sp. WMMC2535 TaxID=2712867 RepID=UPI001556049C|nr:ribulose phosphate epimerase [Pseudenhygromyxa sp. WMMC2535]NVB37333.1 ribulose phosphate epimerase [Pseudenhygromyxa sp. WMMC2535]
MKNLRLLPILLTGLTLGLTACGDKNAEDGDDTVGSTSTTEGEEGTDDTTTGGESSTTAGEESTADEGTTFLMTDVPGTEESCDPWAQDCADGEKCVAYASSGGGWDANKCVPVMGEGQIGDSCSYAGAAEGTDDCGADSWCWDTDEEGQNGTCIPFCSGSADDPMCDAGSSCTIANDGTINVCLPTCDPLLQNCESEGNSCYWDNSGFVCATATEDIPTNGECGYINDCVGGNLCVDASYLPDCAGSAYCDTDDGECTVDGTECVAFWEEGEEIPGLETLGVCILPG